MLQAKNICKLYPRLHSLLAQAVIRAKHHCDAIQQSKTKALCCTNQLEGELPQTPDGFIPHAPSSGCPVA
jgi:hypothetical protein